MIWDELRVKKGFWKLDFWCNFWKLYLERIWKTPCQDFFKYIYWENNL